jgi:polysaccharide biosynthesis transport protein
MQKPHPKEAAKGFGPQDILFVLFKHKWMILLLTCAGIAAAAAVFVKQKPTYQSTAKLLVRYVVETGSVDPYAAMKRPGDAGRGGDPVILTEIEILKSVDLASEVALSVGLDKLLPGLGEVSPEDRSEVISGAAGVILSELEVFQGESPNVLHVTYGNMEKDTAKVVLDKLVESYFKKHLDIHRSAAAFDLVDKQTKEVRARLVETEKKLTQLRTESGITSLTAATDALASQRGRTRDDLMKARAELAEQEARIRALQKANEMKDEAAAENEKQAAPPDDPLERVPPQIITEYRAILEMLSILQKRDLDLRIKFTDANRLVAQNKRQINDYENKRRAMIERYPDLTQEAAATAMATGNAGYDLVMEKTRLAAISAKVEIFNEHLKEIAVQFSEQYALGAEIDALERTRQMEETEFRSLESKLKDAKLDMTLDPKRMPNIEIIQKPTEPVITFDEMTKKIILGLAGGGLALGLGLAFLIELVFNRKIERSVEIQTRLQLPLLLSIPFVRRAERGGLLLGGVKRDAPRIGDNSGEWQPAEGGEEISIASQPGKSDHFILPYSETIRDRIIFNFEINNIIHKPKLVAVTGMSEGAGTSTIAAGLAKSFAEIRGVKVLLVDLSSFHPQENPIFGEIPRHSLPNALRLAQGSDFRERPQNLYYANAPARRDESGLTQFTPLHLHEMMPLLHASEYDYIIFDMPPIDQTSRTLTMAGLMDKVLLVLDAQNTSREGLKWGYSELTKGRADVSCIFNKTRTHGPDWLIGSH